MLFLYVEWILSTLQYTQKAFNPQTYSFFKSAFEFLSSIPLEKTTVITSFEDVGFL